MLPPSNKHLATKSRDVRINDKSLNYRTFVFVSQSCFKAKWSMNNLATQLEWIMSWLFLARAADTSLS